MPTIPPEFFGPFAFTVGLILAVYGAYKEWWVPGSRLHKAEAALQTALELLKGSTEANRTMADALEERNKLDSERLRMAQAGLLDERGEPTRRPRGRTIR
jgi:hypothetical protein